MPHDVVRGPRGRALPPSALEGLREAFLAEVAERLPRLQAVRRDAGPGELAQALRDAHALGSSAVVLGEPEAARVARALEADLLAGHSGGLAAHVALLTGHLARWLR